MARAAASAAEAAFDSVADREVEARQATQSGEGDTAGPSFDSNHVPEAVLDQRTYFIPVMVSDQQFKDFVRPAHVHATHTGTHGNTHMHTHIHTHARV